MNDRKDLNFKLEGFTPDTIPMELLGQFIVQIGLLYGEDSGVRLENVVKGSVMLKHSLPINNYDKSIDKIRTNKSKILIDKLQALLDENNASASLLDTNGLNIIHFPKKNVKIAEPIIIKELAEIDGKVVSNSGENKFSVKLKFHNNGTPMNCRIISEELARSIASNYLETLRFSGEGTWERSERDGWILNDFEIHSFIKPDAQNLIALTKDLRAITSDNWIDESNLWQNLQNEREGA